MVESIGTVGMEASSGRIAASGLALEWWRILVIRTRVIILWGSHFNHYRYPSLFRLSEPVEEKSEEWRWWEILLDWLENRVDSWQLACRSIQFLEIYNCRPFGSRCHEGQILITTDIPYSFSCRSLWKRSRKSEVGERFFWIDLEIVLLAESCRVDWFNSLKFINVIPLDPGAMMTEVVGSIGWYYAFSVDRKSRDVNWFFGDWELRIGDDLASPPPSINKVDPSGGSSNLSEKSVSEFLLCCLAESPCIF